MARSISAAAATGSCGVTVASPPNRPGYRRVIAASASLNSRASGTASAAG